MGRLPDGDGKFKPEALLEQLQDLAAGEREDFFEFLIGTPSRQLEVADGASRFQVEARLDGRTFVKFHLDVGQGDPLSGILEKIKTKDWLGYAGIPAPEIIVVSREQQFAEKVHAYTLPRDDRENTRVRDLVDLEL